MTIYSLEVLFQFAPVHCSISGSNCCFLTYIQASQETGKVVWHSHLFKNCPQLVEIHTVKGFSIVNEAVVDVSLEFSCLFYDPMDVGNLISGSSDVYKLSLGIWKFSVSIPLEPNLENFKHYFASMWNECNCAIVWTSFGVSLLWEWNENWPFTSPVATVFPKLLEYWVQHVNNICRKSWPVCSSSWGQHMWICSNYKEHVAFKEVTIAC